MLIGGTDKLRVTFYGVRGSTPCHGDETRRYGGNTSCVVIAAPGENPLILDLGTGLRYFARTLPHGKPANVNVLLSHLHWDHIQGLPFFAPLLHEETKVHVVAPKQDDCDLEEAMRRAITPPIFPVELNALAATITYQPVTNETFKIDGFDITSRAVPHVGLTLGFRVQWQDKVVTYIPDHQQPLNGAVEFTDGALELMRDADLLIHDAQYLPEEFPRRSNWGHCTTEFAVQGARRSNVKHLALFHHDPGRTDDSLDRIHDALDAETGKSMRLSTAREGLTLEI